MIRTYEGNNAKIKEALLELEVFIGDMENAELIDGSTVDATEVAAALDLVIAYLNEVDAE